MSEIKESFINDKIKIIQMNLKVLQNALQKNPEDDALKNKIKLEKEQIEKFKNSNPEFFI